MVIEISRMTNSLRSDVDVDFEDCCTAGDCVIAAGVVDGARLPELSNHINHESFSDMPSKTPSPLVALPSYVFQSTYPRAIRNCPLPDRRRDRVAPLNGHDATVIRPVGGQHESSGPSVKASSIAMRLPKLMPGTEGSATGPLTISMADVVHVEVQVGHVVVGGDGFCSKRRRGDDGGEEEEQEVVVVVAYEGT
ncbi:hypothetical protein ACMD2_05286 [Ananas comosus]|uniref:Uncharacterized protein n=1 Tax=Ananas comosus TaxID=4615 RepID=A0A199UM03_ANACO|nr:hypothetical protein ACMD2_05286 [Ananas comosus]